MLNVLCASNWTGVIFVGSASEKMGGFCVESCMSKDEGGFRIESCTSTDDVGSKLESS